ncbi:MAG: anti-sigma F factor antagonist [Syntrophomonadaceae bacterium]|jgi:stage II sporulation protein AA (anti-sigma F factor antagonist)|nr:anti-sigma F factor antagonist [Syntrophomonadaceae bacterium]
MELEMRQVRNILIVRIEGEMDMLRADQIREDIDKKLDNSEIRNLILNLEKVTFIDSSGLGMILGRYKKLNSKNGRMYIAGARPQVEKILYFSGINKLITMYRNEQDVINLQGR